MDSLEEYRASVTERLERADVLVARLVHENTVLRESVATQEEQTRAALAQSDRVAAEAAKSNDQARIRTEECELLKDLFERMCGVRVHRTYEDGDGLWFDTSQAGPGGVMDYKLGFVRGSGDSNQNKVQTTSPSGATIENDISTEVIYVPLLRERTSEEVRELQERLPSYMFETLSFPIASLSQFYGKMAKCLTKKR